MDKFISVIMAVYNNQETVSEAIESILNQSYRNFEFIIIDDCSTDKTKEILEYYAKIDNRIKILSNEKNLGLTKSLNIALKKAKGEIIARMDGDDISGPERFEKQLKYIDQYDVVGIGLIEIIDEEKMHYKKNGEAYSKFCVNFNEKSYIKLPESDKEIKNRLIVSNPICHPSVMIKRSILEKVGGYSEEFKTSQDYHLWFKIAGMNGKFYNIIENNLFFYRFDNSYKKRKSLKYRINEIKIRLSGYKIIKTKWYNYIFVIIPLLITILPTSLIKLLKKHSN